MRPLCLLLLLTAGCSSLAPTSQPEPPAKPETLHAGAGSATLISDSANVYFGKMAGDGKTTIYRLPLTGGPIEVGTQPFDGPRAVTGEGLLLSREGLRAPDIVTKLGLLSHAGTFTVWPDVPRNAHHYRVEGEEILFAVDAAGYGTDVMGMAVTGGAPFKVNSYGWPIRNMATDAERIYLCPALKSPYVEWVGIDGSKGAVLGPAGIGCTVLEVDAEYVYSSGGDVEHCHDKLYALPKDSTKPTVTLAEGQPCVTGLVPDGKGGVVWTVEGKDDVRGAVMRVARVGQAPEVLVPDQKDARRPLRVGKTLVWAAGTSLMKLDRVF